jgi:sugar diacid utilization regulator
MLQLSAEAGHTASSTIERLSLYDVLRHLVTTLMLPPTLDEMLHSLATLTQQALKVDRCVILLKDRERDDLRVVTCAPALHDEAADVQPLRIDSALWGYLCDSVLHSQMPRLSDHEQEALNPLKNVHYHALLPVPLAVGSECVGLINCYMSRTTEYSADEQLMLSTIAGQTALAIKHRICAEEKTLVHKALVSALVKDLIAGGLDTESALRRTYLLGYDLANPRVVALLEISEQHELHGATYDMLQRERPVHYESAVGRLKQCLQERYPGTLIDERDNLLVCLLCSAHEAEDEQFKAWLGEIVRLARDELYLRLSVGIGNPCRAIGEYRRGYIEANQALEVARCLDHEGGCRHFDELGAFRYLYTFAQTDILRDTYQDRIATLVEYDRRKETDLLNTLEIYLECSGNAARAACQLKIHRNTLLQRLERIEKLCKLDLEECQQRLPLLIALKVYRLRARVG